MSNIAGVQPVAIQPLANRIANSYLNPIVSLRKLISVVAAVASYIFYHVLCYPYHLYVYHQYKNHPFTPITNAQDLQRERAIFNRCLHSFQFSEVQLDRMRTILETAERRLNSPPPVVVPQPILPEVPPQPSQEVLNLNASRIQRAFHHYQERMKIKETKAAINIQKVARSFLVRLHLKNDLPAAVVEQALTQYVHPNSYENISTAAAGNNRVYLPEDLPVVIKIPRDLNRIEDLPKRFANMHKVQRICDKKRYTHLIVPRANLCENTLIEEKLPINPDYKYNLGFYLDHRVELTDAIKEFTHFTCQDLLTDLITRRGVNKTISGFEIGRFDNIPLYVVEKDGQKKYCIGLIDLDYFHKRDYESNAYDFISRPLALNAVRTNISLFPHHLEEIIEIGKIYYPQMEDHRAELVEIRDRSLNGIQIHYQRHLDFLNNHHIRFDNPCDLILPSEDRKEAILEAMKAKLKEKVTCWDTNRRADNPTRPSLLGPDPEATLEGIKRDIFPKVWDAFFNSLTEELEAHQKKTIPNGGPPTSMPQVVNMRTIIISNRNDHDENQFINTIKDQLTFDMRNRWKEDIAKFLIIEILDQLAQGTEIAFLHKDATYELNVLHV